MSVKSDVSQEKEVNFEIKAFSNEKKKDLNGFDCGDKILNNCLINGKIKELTNQKIVTCMLLMDLSNSKVVGFYTLKNHSLARGDFEITGKYQSIPVTKLDMLAVDKIYQGQGLGIKLLRQAISNALEASKHVGSNGIYLEAVEDKVEFYSRLGFTVIGEAKTHSSGNSLVPMYLSMLKVRAAVSHNKKENVA
ncbi:GNAT family N-acetyltransferase [Oceanimonas smirnovii]|uniref:GNAT family N-acetyltransferase n=1 Tax=Oceanimonas smirnovii TaxID=264574 RepID=UPI003FD01E40